MVIALSPTGASGVSILLRGTYGSAGSAAQERGEGDGMGGSLKMEKVCKGQSK